MITNNIINFNKQLAGLMNDPAIPTSITMQNVYKKDKWQVVGSTETHYYWYTNPDKVSIKMKECIMAHMHRLGYIYIDEILCRNIPKKNIGVNNDIDDDFIRI